MPVEKDAAQAQGLSRQAARGGVALVVRQIVTQALTLAGGLALLRFLQPEDLALYAVIAILRDWYALVADLGLGATLIRQSEPLTRAQQRGLWSLQCLVSLAVALALTVADPWAVTSFGWPAPYAGVLTLVGWGLLLVPFRAVPAVLLLQRLALDRFALIEVSESAAFVAVALGGAIAGWGSWAVAWGVVARFVTGALVANALCRWPIGWYWPWQVPFSWRLGLGYQAGNLLTLLKESTLPLLLALVFAPRTVGYLKWALTVALLPLVLPLSLDRLFFPLLSRVRDEPEQLRRWVVRSVQANCLVVVWLCALLAVLAEPLVCSVLGSQWLPALPYFYGLLPTPLAFAPVFALIQAYQAQGRPQVNFALNCGWLGLLWLGTWFAVPAMGPMGFVAASLAVHIASLALMAMAARDFRIDFVRELWPLVVAGTLATLTGFGLARLLPMPDLPRIALVGVVVSAVYAAGLWALWRDVLEQGFEALRAGFSTEAPRAGSSVG